MLGAVWQLKRHIQENLEFILRDSEITQGPWESRGGGGPGRFAPSERQSLALVASDQKKLSALFPFSLCSARGWAAMHLLVVLSLVSNHA